MATCTSSDDGSNHELRARGYQITISQIAVKENAIVVLPTGTGKTQIAIMVIKELGHEVRLPYNEGGMRSFFLVPFKVLVEQQAAEIVEYTDFEKSDVGRFTGDLNVDSWCKQDWIDRFVKYKILVMTAQIFKDLVDKDYLPLSKVNLVVFDECHHAAMKKKNKETNHVYKQIMTSMRLKDPTLKPRILGLTASVINNKAEADVIKEMVQDLERTYSARCISVEPAEVLKFRTKAVQVVWKCPENYGAHRTVPIVNIFNEAIGDLELEFKRWEKEKPKRRLPISWSDMKASLRNISDSASEFGTWLAMQACEMYSSELRQQSLFFQDTMPGFSALLLQLIKFISWSKNILNYVIDMHRRSLPTVDKQVISCLRLVSPKMLRLLQILENYSDGRHKLKGIIFVEKRWDAKILCLWLGEVSKLVPTLSFLKPGYLIGYSSRPGLTSKLVVKSRFEQKETIRKFRIVDQSEDSLNILVATSVLEEGLNVTDCNLVIRFHPPSTFKSWLQSSGRARAEDARFVLMPALGAEYNVLMEELADFEATDKALNAYCLRNEGERDDSRVPEDMEQDDKKLLERTVKSKTTWAIIDAGKAISTINSYCQQLDTDWISQPVDEPVKDGYRFLHHVKLPMIAAYTKKVSGEYMSNSKNAKKSAYLELCRRLYEEGGLDEYLQPVRKEELIRRAVEKLGVEIPREVVPDGSAKPGTSKRKQIYKKMIHPCFETGIEDRWFLYRIHIVKDREVCVNRIESNDGLSGPPKIVDKRCCGFLTRREVPLDTINTSFPVFRRNYIKMDVSIELVARDIQLTEVEKKKLIEYHKYLFNEVLGFRQTRFKYGGNEGFPESDFLVVPVHQSGKIDFVFLDEVERKRNEPDGVIRNEDGHGIMRNGFVFKKEDYEDCLVLRWYNHADNQEFKIPVEDKEEEHTKTLFTGAFHVVRVRFPCKGCHKCQDCISCRGCQRCGSCERCKKCVKCEQCVGIYATSDFPFSQRTGKNREGWESTPKTYQDYYYRKYGIVINDLNQPLLEVDYTEKLASPHIPIRVEGAKLFCRVQHFVPELCVICPIPLPFWEDAVCLPTIFYRLNQLLLSSFLLVLLRDEVRINGFLVTQNFGRLQWKSSVACFVDRKMKPPILEHSRQSLVDLLDEDAGMDLVGNWGDFQEPVDEDDGEDDESETERDEETGETFHLNQTSHSLDDASGSQSIEVLSTLGPSLYQTRVVDVDSNHLYDDVRKETSIKFDTILGELRIPSFETEAEREKKERIEKIKLALNGIISGSNGLPFDEYNLDMEESETKHPLRNLDSFKDMPRFGYETISSRLTPEVILETLTCKSAQDYLNMERYETMGDSFLKLATIEYFHAIAPRLPEGCLTYIKSQHVSNYNLYRLAKKINLARLMHIQQFHGHVTWCPPGFVISPKREHKEGEAKEEEAKEDRTTFHHVADKQIADCVESLIGAIMINCGRIDAIKFMSFLGLRVTDVNREDLSALKQHWIREKLYPFDPDMEDAGRKINELYNNSYLNRVEKTLNYEFKDKGWLLMAYTHSSNLDNDVTGCYQRLELLGDAVLDFLITRFLFSQKTMDRKKSFERYFDPGELTDLRSALVNNVFFGCVLTKYHLHKSLLASPDLKSQINTIADRFLQEFDDTKKTTRYVEHINGFYVHYGENLDFGATSIEIPKILGDMFEALFGAIYLDSNRDLNVVWEILYSMISEELKHFCVDIPRNPVQLVYLNDKNARFSSPSVCEDTESKKRIVYVNLKYLKFDTFEGRGENKKFAKIDAARQAIFKHEETLKSQIES